MKKARPFLNARGGKRGGEGRGGKGAKDDSLFLIELLLLLLLDEGTYRDSRKKETLRFLGLPRLGRHMCW